MFGERLRVARARARKTLRDVAREIGRAWGRERV